LICDAMSHIRHMNCFSPLFGKGIIVFTTIILKVNCKINSRCRKSHTCTCYMVSEILFSFRIAM
jgi:hypothetical protein